MVAGAPWLQDGLARDYIKDEAGYKKIGGSANSPAMPYFFRSQQNLIHYLKRKNFTCRAVAHRPRYPGWSVFLSGKIEAVSTSNPTEAG